MEDVPLEEFNVHTTEFILSRQVQVAVLETFQPLSKDLSLRLGKDAETSSLRRPADGQRTPTPNS